MSDLQVVPDVGLSAPRAEEMSVLNARDLQDIEDRKISDLQVVPDAEDMSVNARALQDIEDRKEPDRALQDIEDTKEEGKDGLRFVPEIDFQFS
eukprot:CAMPEP_0205829008 /NCGR_PEP_ID=MMETSP0206-20130828/36746_1 /ASSEMBLY_ACC=CAM_ASM_000279 /TAXON_ID=36767 /ORGANISM="Euplotes focardii, Strain TN1" /LENGTH=93 /DNA_ID=CAMNT_0053131335 /DNA_START=21 /DNA_END=299 /DNA_ORIENTATION=-